MDWTAKSSMMGTGTSMPQSHAAGRFHRHLHAAMAAGGVPLDTHPHCKVWQAAGHAGCWSPCRSVRRLLCLQGVCLVCGRGQLELLVQTVVSSKHQRSKACALHSRVVHALSRCLAIRSAACAEHLPVNQEENTGKVVDTAFDFFASTIASADSLKRYQGLRSALRMMALQVIPPPCLLAVRMRHCESSLPVSMEDVAAGAKLHCLRAILRGGVGLLPWEMLNVDMAFIRRQHASEHN